MNEAGQPTAEAPADRLMINSLDTLRLLADPLRMRLMSAFTDSPDAALTVKQLAAQLGVRPTRLYYHINLLEEHGLLKVAGSRVVSGIIEKSYSVSARSITVDPALLKVSSAGRAAAAETVTALMQATAAEVVDAIEISAAHQDDPALRQMHIGKTGGALSQQAHAEFLERLNALVDEFSERYATKGKQPNRGLFVAYYPLAAVDEETE